jgi:hypothetical protein
MLPARGRDRLRPPETLRCLLGCSGCTRSSLCKLTKQESKCQFGDVAQMVERSLSMREARGSIPRISSFFICPQFIFYLSIQAP